MRPAAAACRAGACALLPSLLFFSGICISPAWSGSRAWRWLHGYLASHKNPYPIKLETIRRGAGLSDDTKSDLKKTIPRALESLKKVGFLVSYEIVDDLVTVERAKITIDL